MKNAPLLLPVLAFALLLPALTAHVEGSELSSRGVQARSSHREPSVWEKFNSGTKTFFVKTKHTLMPWTAEPEKPTRARSGRSHSKTAEKKGSFFSSWFQPEQEEPIQSVNEFLALPRVEP